MAGINFCNRCGAGTRPGQIMCVACGCALQGAISSAKNKVAAGLLGIFLGAFGIHKFYLGYNKAAIIMLAVTIVGSFITFGLAGLAMSIIGLIEGIIYLTKSDAEFAATYVTTARQWF